MMSFPVAILVALLAVVAVEAKTMTHISPPESRQFEEGDQGIVGGTDVIAGTYPFYGHFEGNTMCGGVLVHEDIFVTAAHCLENGFPPFVTIGATSTDATSENAGQEVSVCAGLIHPNNNMKAMENDIAILKLCDSVEVSTYARYNSNPSYPSATGTDLWIVGFGRTNPAGTLSTRLQVAKVDYLNDETCKARFTDYDSTQTMCADAPNTGICYGDSGGPLMDEDNLVVGFASFIIDTCASNFPDFFSRVSTYASWLDEQVCSQAINPPIDCPASTASGGTGAQDEGEDDDEDGGEDESPLTQCLDLILDLVSGFQEAMRGLF